MLQFRLLGFPVTIEPFFWVNMALIFGAISADSPEAIGALVVQMASGFVSILIHELGHALTMRRLGDQRVDIVLHGFGGFARGSRHLDRWQSLTVSAAGPALQFASGVAVSVWIYPALADQFNAFGRLFLASFANVSRLWALLNLLPILPLDGGHICRSLLGTNAALRISAGLAGLVALYLLLGGSLIGALLLGMLAYQNWRTLKGNL